MKKIIRRNFKKITILFLLIILFVFIIPTILVNNIKKDWDEKGITIENSKLPNSLIYSISDLIDYSEAKENSIDISIENSEDVLFNENILEVKISNINSENYEVEYGTEDNKKQVSMNTDSTIHIELEEGENNCIININKQGEEIQKWTKVIYYIDGYKEQFLDEIKTTIGIATHFGATYEKDDERAIEFLTELGIKNVRDDIRWGSVEKDGQYNFEQIDTWIESLTANDIKILPVFGFPTQSQAGSDYKVSNEEELNRYIEYVKTVLNRYPQIENYELWNEANNIYKEDEEIQMYATMAKLLNEQIEDKNIILGANSTPDKTGNGYLASEDFFQKLYDTNLVKKLNNISFHLYDWGTYWNINYRFKVKLNAHNIVNNELGGFQKIYMTEYGVHTSKTNKTQEEQAIQLVEQAIISQRYNIEEAYVYDLRNMGTDIGEMEDNFGIITYDYKPKKAYYALKNYNENTNGAEYIGRVNLENGIEAHVYDKDGKPKIIVWATDEDNPITIDYKDFTAKDIYGKSIENSNGKLEITISPVYLDNLSTNYFYQAISNTFLEKYNDFEEKFTEEIAEIEGLQEEINNLKEYMQNIFSLETETEEVAKQKMEEHFELGNLILEAYKNGNLDIEYVKLSSMLDMLNDIGNSYEDLVTVSSKTNNPDLQNTKTLIDTVELELKNNSDIEIIYPNKILEFSKDLYEKSEYINNLEEKNDIKIGLIVSYNLHAKYLANWAQIFTNIYIDEYMESNPVTISYSETNLTNKDVVATINANDINITNNEGKNTYTFTENDTFIFEYIRRGRNQEIEAKVNNIDKKVPEILNLTDRQILFESVVPNISDENLDKIILKKDGQVITYSQGDIIQDNGLYELTVIDKATNEISIKFRIADEPEYNYTIEDGYISNVKTQTTLEEFKKNYITIDEYNILHNDTELENDDIVSTGDIVQLSDGTTYTIIVAGDINKDGKVTAYDLSMLRNYLLRISQLNNLEMLAADANCDKKTVGASDYSEIRLILLGKE